MIFTLQIISLLLYRLFFETYALIGNTDLKNVIVPPLLMYIGAGLQTQLTKDTSLPSVRFIHRNYTCGPE
jgi:hypothetical protein